MKILSTLLFSTCVCFASLAHAEVSTTSSSPSVADHLNNAHKAMLANDWRGASATLEQALRDDPSNADVHNLLGYYYRKRATPDLNKAFEHYNTALRINPNHKAAHEYIGEAYLMANKPADAEKHLARLETICGNKTCEEYAELNKAIATWKAASK
ncbi:hypothetical protein BH11PSE11_BH11PSE11_28420 [soil metagenome]